MLIYIINIIEKLLHWCIKPGSHLRKTNSSVSNYCNYKRLSLVGQNPDFYYWSCKFCRGFEPMTAQIFEVQDFRLSQLVARPKFLQIFTSVNQASVELAYL